MKRKWRDFILLSLGIRTCESAFFFFFFFSWPCRHRLVHMGLGNKQVFILQEIKNFGPSYTLTFMIFVAVVVEALELLLGMFSCVWYAIRPYGILV